MYNLTGTGTGVLGNASSVGVLGVGSGSVSALPFTGLPITLAWMLLAALTVISLGVMLLRLGRLATAEITTDSGVFLR